jgi:hypothetical protein
MSRYPPKLDGDALALSRPPSYRSYLLRIWEERGEPARPPVWRFNLEDPHTGERRGFATLESVVEWLDAELKSSVQCLDLHTGPRRPAPARPAVPPKTLDGPGPKRARRPSQ